MVNNKEMIKFNIAFESQAFNQFADCNEELNKEGIYQYMEKLFDLLNKNKEQIFQIKTIIVNYNYLGLKMIIYKAYLLDIWYMQFGFEYKALFNQILSQVNYNGNIQDGARRQFGFIYKQCQLVHLIKAFDL
ncbi:hypothetical protein pb186bvf_015031 [Paramecium bursaria]